LSWRALVTPKPPANARPRKAKKCNQSERGPHAGRSSTAESQAVDSAKAYLRKLRNALPRALRESPALGVTAASFHAGETLGRSTPKISKYLAAIRPAVATLDAALKPHFGSAAGHVVVRRILRRTAPATTRRRRPD